MSMAFYIFLQQIGQLISAFSQMLLKKSAMEDHLSGLSEYMNFKVISAYVLFVITTLVSVLVYRGLPFAMVPVLETTGYIYVTVLGVKVFHERLTKGKVFSLALILAGIFVYSVFG